MNFNRRLLAILGDDMEALIASLRHYLEMSIIPVRASNLEESVPPELAGKIFSHLSNAHFRVFFEFSVLSMLLLVSRNFKLKAGFEREERSGKNVGPTFSLFLCGDESLHALKRVDT